MTDPTREEIIARFERAEAKLEAKIADFVAGAKVARAETKSEIASLAAKISVLPSTWTVVGTIISVAVVGISLFLGILAFGGDRFDGGVQLNQSSVEQAVEARRAANENSKQLKAVIERMDKQQTQLDEFLPKLLETIKKGQQ